MSKTLTLLAAAGSAAAARRFKVLLMIDAPAFLV